MSQYKHPISETSVPIMPLADMMKEYVIDVVHVYKGNYTKAAKVLGIHRNTITSLVGPAKEFKRRYHK